MDTVSEDSHRLELKGHELIVGSIIWWGTRHISEYKPRQAKQGLLLIVPED